MKKQTQKQFLDTNISSMAKNLNIEESALIKDYKIDTSKNLEFKEWIKNTHKPKFDAVITLLTDEYLTSK